MQSWGSHEGREPQLRYELDKHKRDTTHETGRKEGLVLFIVVAETSREKKRLMQEEGK